MSVWDMQMDKIWRKSVRDQQKRIKPGECQKYVRLLIDNAIIFTTYGNHLLLELNKSTIEFKYELKQLPIKNSILWERNMGQLIVDPSAVAALNEEWQLEKPVVRVLTEQELNVMINQNTVNEYYDELRTHYPTRQHIVLFLRDGEKLTKQTVQTLLEFQVVYNIKVLEIDRHSQVQNMKDELLRLTKSISEVPFKQQKSMNVEHFKKFLVNDKRQCVRIEGKNGFRLLWQQHLNRLPMVTLEVAEAVIEKYSCPKKLLDDFQNLVKEETIKELANLKIKRCGNQAIATCDRRLGPVMAQKIYALYNTKNPEATI